MALFAADNRRKQRWYFGGLASAGAACVTHPLDLLKVHLQTQQTGNMRMTGMAVHICKTQGFFCLYNGISASLLRQLTYSLARFGIYDQLKTQSGVPEKDLRFYQRVGFAGLSGFLGGVVGTPADMVNVRMQNDIKLPKESRRNYKHALDGLYQVWRKEGFMRLFSGVTMASSRAVLMTIGQIAFYDQVKQIMLESGYFADNILTHFSASIIAAGIATALTQPVDVAKTRLMNAKPGQYAGIASVFVEMGKAGPLGFFKGFVPAFIRLGPHTVLTFVFLEQLRCRFGFLPDSILKAEAAKKSEPAKK